MNIPKFIQSPLTKVVAAVALAGGGVYGIHHHYQGGAEPERSAQEVALVREDIEKSLIARIEHTKTKPFPPGLLHFERDRIQDERMKTVRSYEMLLKAHLRGTSRKEFAKELESMD